MQRRTPFLAGTLIWLLHGCTSLPTDYERITTTALEDPAPNTAHSMFAEEVEAHPGQSGFVLLASGESAFAARDDMMAIADKTIDAQYFLWHSDQTGRLFLDRLIRAADRGVRVRLLIDDIATDGKDVGIAHLDNLPNVEVRLFNPLAHRNARVFDFLGDLSRVNRRMHNKALIVDNTLAVVGGRNIGNHYFGVDTVFNYRDLDVMAVGPVVPQISEVFDEFWNSEYAVPIEVFVEEDLQLEETRRLQQELHAWAEAGGDDYPYPVLRDRENNIQSLEAARAKLIWPNYVELLFDDPEKAGGDEDSPFVSRGDLLAEQVKSEVMIETPYFVPQERLVERFRNMVDRGVRVRILTNSLASIDMVPAFAGYSNYREPLLRSGVELHELKADVEVTKKYWSFVALQSRATVHTKAMVADREWVYVGSFNADPRSRNINTEVGLLIHDPELSGEVADFIETGMIPESSYQLSLNEGRGPGERLTWVEEVDGEEIQHNDEPDAPLWLIASSWFMSLLPIEDQL